MRAVTTLLLLLVTAARAEDPLVDALAALRAAAPGARAEAVRAVLALDVAFEDVLAALRSGVPVAPAAPGWHMGTAVDAKGVGRPYQLYVPRSLEGRREPVPLLVNLHGGVSRPAFLEQEGQVGGGQLWLSAAEDEGFVCAFPMGRQDCTWWSDAGVDHIRAVIREAKRHANIDDDRIVGSGFSDGGSGCYYLAMAAPDPFAAFLPLNGHPAVASRGGGKPLYIRNIVLTPLFVAMTQDDPLYPAATVLPHVEMAMRAGAALTVASYPSGGHTPAYFEEQGGAFVRFLLEVRRDPLPKSLDWWCAEPATGSVRWIEVVATGPGESDAEEVEDLNPVTTPGRVLLGIEIDRDFAGEGVRVARVRPGTLAAEMGMRDGDVLAAVDGSPVADFEDLRAVLGDKTCGDAVSVTVRRGAEDHTFAGNFPTFVPEPVYLRTGPTARVSARVEGDTIRLVTRNVRRLRLHFAYGFVDPDSVRVIVNGAELPATVVARTPVEVLDRYALEADVGRLFAHDAVVEIP